MTKPVGNEAANAPAPQPGPRPRKWLLLLSALMLAAWLGFLMWMVLFV